MAARGTIEVIARGLLLRDGTVLLCRNRKGGYYYLPGGHVEFGEPAAAALKREFMEETGLLVRIGAVAAIAEAAFTARGKKHHEINVVFLVEREGAGAADVESREESICFEWIDLSGLAGVDLRPPSIRTWLTERHRHDVGRGGADWLSWV